MTVSDLRLQHQSLPKEEVEEVILKALRQRKGSLTIHDLVLATGLPSFVLEPVFRSMVQRYDSTVSSNAAGELIYRFEPGLVPLDGGESLRQHRLRKKLWAAFKVFYKILIVVILAGYVIAFVALLIAAFVLQAQSRQGGQNQRRPARRSSSGPSFGSYWMMSSLMGGRRRARFRTAPSRFSPLPPKDTRPIWEKVFSFVFGLDPIGDDPLVDQKQLLAYIVQQKGIIAPMELSARTGWSPAASERESSKLLAEFDGGVDILADGQTVFAFDSLRDAVPAGTQPTPAFWNRFEFEATNSGNPKQVDFVIGGLNLFVLVSSVYIAPAFIIPTVFMSPEFMLPPLGEYLSLLFRDYFGVTLGLMLIPGLFSLSFFGIPLGRYLRTTRPENDARKQRNARRLILREVYSRALKGRTQATELNLIGRAMKNRRPKDAILAAGLQISLRDAMREVAHEWKLPADVNSEGERVYDLSVIQEQHQEAATIRSRPGSIATNRMRDEFAAFDDELLETPAEAPNFTPASSRAESPIVSDDF